MLPLFRSLVLHVILCAVLLRPAVHAQDMPVPVELQAPLMIKVFSYDRALKALDGNVLMIAIIYQSEYRLSAVTKTNIIAQLSSLPEKVTNGWKLKLVELQYTSTQDLESELKRKQIQIAYITPMRAVDIGGVASVLAKYKVRSVTGVPDYVRLGLTVGFDSNAEKPVIMVNHPAVRATGIDFNAQLLKLSRIIE